MLSSLHIENVAVIKSVDIDFKSGFTVLSGQTGAGKTIILDCIELLLGAKSDKELIRHGKTTAVVSGLFTGISDKTAALLNEAGIPLDEERALLIHRSFSTDGKSTLKLNGRSVTLTVLRSISYSLVNIHGQSDTSALVDADRHIELVDTYAGNAELLSEYREVYAELEEIRRKIREVKEKAGEGERLREIYEYQIRDIDSAHLEPGEEEALVERKVKLRNSEKLSKNAEFVYKALKGSEKGSIAYLIDRSITASQTISGVIPSFTEFTEKLRDMLYQVEDMSEEIYDILDELETDPTEALNAVESRLDKINKLKRKYGLTIEEILAFRDRTASELSAIDNCDEIIEKLSRDERAKYKEALSLADRLHESRVFHSSELESGVKETLEFLDMPKVVFFAKISEYNDGDDKALNPNGYDVLEFYISANQGADAQPMSKIASGGELARVMLALKGVITDKDGISTVVFDEIDAGVSGKTARKIGIRMLELSKNTQIFCVTHSAQIASLADMHYLIAKSAVDGETETHVSELDFDGRLDELSRILGGINITSSQRQAALDMLNERERY